MKNTRNIATPTQRHSTKMGKRFVAGIKRSLASDIVSYPATRDAGVVALPNRASKRAAVADIVGGVSDRETLAAA